MNEQVHLVIRGKVQGVFYRVSAAETARALGLCGWVRNLPDGSVEAVAQGPKQALDTFIEWCRSGPPAARVDEIDTRWDVTVELFSAFTVRR